MRTFAKVLFHLALAVWIGALVVVSFVVAPVVFQALPSETAGTVMGQVFPIYYGLTMAAGVVALGSATWLRRCAGTTRTWRAVLTMLAVMLAATIYAGTVVSPRARTLRPALHREPVDPALRAEFDGLHRRAVQLNGLVLVLGLSVVAVVARALRLPGED